MAKQIALHEETGEMWKRRKRKPFLQYARHHWWLYLMIVPGAIYFIIFKYIPIASLVIAFQDYNPWLGIMDSPFVGMKHFETFFMAFLTFIMVILVIYLEEKDFRRRADTYVFSV